MSLVVKRRAGRLFLDLLSITSTLLITAAFLWLVQYAVRDDPRSSVVSLVLFTAAALFYSTFVLNINFASPHAFYRDRIARTYLTRAVGGDQNVERRDPQPLSRMNPEGKAPYHLVKLRGQYPWLRAPQSSWSEYGFLLFQQTLLWRPDNRSRAHGSAGKNGFPSGPWDCNGHLRRRGGAQYGHNHVFPIPFLAGPFESSSRLLVEEACTTNRCIGSLPPPIGWYYFLLEITGLMSDKTRYLNMSDGGHIENLGIYELLRRRCKFVIAIDGEADPQRSFGGLLTLTQLAKIDLGVTIEPDLADLRVKKDGFGGAHFGLSRIDYPNGEWLASVRQIISHGERIRVLEEIPRGKP